MKWEILYHDEYDAWFCLQPETLQDEIFKVVELLSQKGPSLARPHADTLKQSSLKNLKELRVQWSGDPYRILFVFDPMRQAILLLGGNKTGDKRWYDNNIPIAEKRYSEHLRVLKKQKGEKA